MFNHYHYWPEHQAYLRQEELLEQIRVEQLIRSNRASEPGPVARIARAIRALANSIVTQPRKEQERALEPRRQLAAHRS